MYRQWIAHLNAVQEFLWQFSPDKMMRLLKTINPKNGATSASENNENTMEKILNNAFKKAKPLYVFTRRRMRK